jgi:hypothetical protein
MIRLSEKQPHPFYQARAVSFLTQKPVLFWDEEGNCYVAVPQGESSIPGVVVSQAYFAYGPEIYNPKTEMVQWHPPGSVHHGSHRYEDLIPRLMNVLEEYDRNTAAKLTSSYAREGWAYSMAGLGWGDPFDEIQMELAPHLLEDLFNALQEIAPPGTYFGAHVGDGSDFGFWSHDEEYVQDLVSGLEQKWEQAHER